jgi:hypothetical protein
MTTYDDLRTTSPEAMTDFAVILPRVLEIDEITALVRRGLAVSVLPSGAGLRAVYVSASDGRAAVDHVLSCVSLTAWEADGVRVVAGSVNPPA